MTEAGRKAVTIPPPAQPVAHFLVVYVARKSIPATARGWTMVVQP
jgi:hypothetical protein